MRITTPLSLFFIFLSFSSLNAQLFINEWMAINNDVIADNADEYDDWIEIYNAGLVDVDLADYYITDDLSDPTLWQIPDTNPSLTTVPAGGFLLLWADKDSDQGAHHVDFKLSAGGETIALFLPDGSTVVDQVLFGPQNSNISFGRSTDGSGLFQLFTDPTPGTSNNMSGSATTYTGIITIPVIQSSDDAEEPVGQPFTSINESILNIVNDWSGDQTVGVRFQNIPLEPGATISKSYIQFTTGFPGASVGVCDLTVRGESSINALTFDESAQNISSRLTTATAANWLPEEWNAFDEAGEKQQTPDLSEIIDEIISLPGWAADNSMAFIFNGSGLRVPWAFDGNPNFAPRLHIESEFPTPTTAVENLFINEIAARGTDYGDEAGECDDWLELYNGGIDAIDIGGLFLTDDLDNLTKWQISQPLSIPAGGFATLWVDNDEEQGGLHANFSLSGAGESVALVQILNNDITIIDSITFGDMPFKGSFGRSNDGGSAWQNFGEITPGANNNNAADWLDLPQVSLASGAYNGMQEVTISHADIDATIYYSLDGSEPDISSAVYTGPISIIENTSLVAKAFKLGFTPSLSTRASYLLDEDLSLPAVYINTDPANFFDDSIGVYVEGTNGITGFCSAFPANWNQPWERPINLSMMKDAGDAVFSVNAGISIGGGCSRTYAMKSLNISLREKKYGDRRINYPLYEGRDHQNYQRLKLRNSGQDYLRMAYRDGLLHTLLWDKVDLELQAFQPSVVYLNGEFWGLHNIRELYVDEFFDAVYDVNPNKIDIIKNPNLPWQEIKKGSDAEYNELYEFLENNDFSIDANYQHADSLIDINEFTNYWAVMIYMANADWPANNIIVWKEKKVGEKWRYAVMDTDGSTSNGFDPNTEANFNTLEFATDDMSQSWPNHSNSTLAFRRLIENPQFRNEYIQRTCSFIHLIYDAERVSSYSDSIQNMLTPYIDQHIAKYGFDNAVGGNTFSWNAWISNFKQFFVDRPDFFRGFIDSHFNLNGTYELTLNYNQNTGGTVVVNTNEMETPYNYTGLYFKDIPLQVKAIPKPNYEFLYWLETGETEPTINFFSTNDAVLTPIFQIDVNLGADTSVCAGGEIQLDATIPGCTDCSYLWSDGSTDASIVVMPSGTTTYSVSVTDISGTPGTDEITVSIFPSPQSEATSNDVACPGGINGSIDLTVSSGSMPYTYLWNMGADVEDPLDLPAASYAVTVTDANGCTDVLQDIVINAPDDFEVSTTADSTDCANGNEGAIDLFVDGGTGPYMYNWSNGSTAQNISNLTSGTYTVTITDNNNCTTTTSEEVAEPALLDATFTTTIPSPGDNDGSIEATPIGGTPPYTITWFNGTTGPIISGLPLGIYSVTITDANGCSYQEVIDFFPTATTEPVGLQYFEIRPNPAIEYFTGSLLFKNQTEFVFEMYNAVGQLVQSSRHNAKQLDISVDLKQFAAGLYLVRIKTDDGSALRKLLVE